MAVSILPPRCRRQQAWQLNEVNIKNRPNPSLNPNANPKANPNSNANPNANPKANPNTNPNANPKPIT